MYVYVLCAKSFYSCPTLCNHMDWNPQRSSVHGILQARILEWVAISSSMGSSQPRDGNCVSSISCVYIFISIYIFELNKRKLSEFWMLEVWDQGWQGWFLLRPLSLACCWPSSSCVFTWSVLCVFLHPYQLFLQGHQSFWVTAHPNYFIYLSLPYKDPVSKYSHILRY